MVQVITPLAASTPGPELLGSPLQPLSGLAETPHMGRCPLGLLLVLEETGWSSCVGEGQSAADVHCNKKSESKGF